MYLQTHHMAGRFLYFLMGLRLQSYLTSLSLSSCCVDEVAAQHIDANAVVHYGHACMSQCVNFLELIRPDLIMSRTYRLPVLYVFGKKPIDVDNCVTSLLDTFSSNSSLSRRKTIIMRHDVAYTHQAGKAVALCTKTLVSAFLFAQVIFLLDSKQPSRIRKHSWYIRAYRTSSCLHHHHQRSQSPQISKILPYSTSEMKA